MRPSAPSSIPGSCWSAEAHQSPDGLEPQALSVPVVIHRETESTLRVAAPDPEELDDGRPFTLWTGLYERRASDLVRVVAMAADFDHLELPGLRAPDAAPVLVDRRPPLHHLAALTVHAGVIRIEARHGEHVAGVERGDHGVVDRLNLRPEVGFLGDRVRRKCEQEERCGESGHVRGNERLLLQHAVLSACDPAPSDGCTWFRDDHPKLHES